MNIYHIFKKELRTYFNSSIAYVFFIFFLLIVGFFVFLSIARYSEMSMFMVRSPGMMDQVNPQDMILTPLFSLMAFLLIFLVPVLTMKLFSEEKKLGTIELLFTYPITEFQLVMGKLLASIVVLLVIFVFSLSYMVIYGHYFTPNSWGPVISGYLGLFLVSMSFLAFGMWVSSLTADQVTSALATVGGILIFWVIGAGKTATYGTLGDVLSQISLVEHFQPFSKGIIDTHDVVFFLCFIFFFIFLTIQVLEVRKWKG